MTWEAYKRILYGNHLAVTVAQLYRLTATVGGGNKSYEQYAHYLQSTQNAHTSVR